jgi:cobalt-zinc-cadmium efflux system membrane fusion protein
MNVILLSSSILRRDRARVQSTRAGLAAALLVAGVLAGCGDTPTAQAPAAPQASKGAAAPADPNVVAAPAALAERLELGRVERRAVAEPLSVVGRIDFDEQSVARIGASVTGRITDLAGALGMTVTAEGIEEADQATALTALGCSRMQGYLFSRPMPAVELTELLARQDRDRVLR